MRPVNPYPFIAVVGDTGDGKTLSLVAIGHTYHLQGKKVFANFEITGYPYTHISFEDLAAFPDFLVNGVVLLDEAHIGLDAYDFFNKAVRNSTTFATQRRKRKLTLILATQLFNSLTPRLRQLTNYVFECYRTTINGVVLIRIFDRGRLRDNSGYIKSFYLDGRPYFNFYNTDEIILKSP